MKKVIVTIEMEVGDTVTPFDVSTMVDEALAARSIQTESVVTHYPRTPKTNHDTQSPT